MTQEKALQALHSENERLGLYKDAYAEQEPKAWRRREVGGGWQYYGWEETGMTYESVNRSNKNGFECEAIPATPPQRERVLFPTMLRKMWSGGEVQQWLDENVNKEKNT